MLKQFFKLYRRKSAEGKKANDLFTMVENADSGRGQEDETYLTFISSYCTTAAGARQENTLVFPGKLKGAGSFRLSINKLV